MTTQSAARSQPATDRPDPVTAKAYLQTRRRQILGEAPPWQHAGDNVAEQVLPLLYSTLAAERIVDASLGFMVTDVDHGTRLGLIKGFSKDVQRCLTFDLGKAICGTVALTRQPMHVSDVQRSLDPMADLVRSAGINAFACEPLIVAGRLIGTLSFASRLRRSFDAEDILFFRAIAKRVAIARAAEHNREPLEGRV